MNSKLLSYYRNTCMNETPGAYPSYDLPPLTEIGGTFFQEESPLYKWFVADGRFFPVVQPCEQKVKGGSYNAINSALRAAELQINPESYGANTLEAILYYAAHLLYITFVKVESEILNVFKKASDGVSNSRSFAPYHEAIRSGEMRSSIGYSNSPFGHHLRTLTQETVVGVVGLWD